MKISKSGAYIIFNHSTQGASHIKKNVVCQDFSISKKLGKYFFTAVADGHGSEKYFRSNVGAQLACEVADECVKSFMNDVLKVSNEKFKNNHDAYLKQLEQNVLYSWRRRVEDHIEKNPFTPEEEVLVNEKYKTSKAYGTTLIVNVLYPKRFSIGIQIGDGKCVAYKEGSNFFQPIPWDDQCFLNVTTSLCDDNALDNFRHFVSFNDIPDALFIGTDGIDDSFSDDKQLYDFYRQILNTLKENGIDKGEKEICDFLPVLSAKGSGDDISLAYIINKEID